MSAPAQDSGIAIPSGVGRAQFLAGVIALVLANAVTAKVLQSFAQTGAAATLSSGLGVSWTYWLACAACLWLAWTQDPAPLRPRDLWLGAACVGAALVPISQASGLACTLLGLAILIDKGQGVRIKAAAMILIAISIQVLWSRLLMLFFVGPIATLDAHAISLIIQRPVVGNEVRFVDNSHKLSILSACTSVQNASMALMLYVTVVRSFRPRPRWSEIYALAGVFASVVAINYARLVLMAQNIEMFNFVHSGAGWPITEAIITVTILAWAIGSVRREIFA
jgi:exosortase/archaeosortase family protein